MLTRDTILSALQTVIDRPRGISVVEAGMISGIRVDGGKVSFLITIAPQERVQKEWLREACERAVAAVAGVGSVTAVLTAETRGQEPRKAVWNTDPIPHVKRLIAVASGKGGVGKSTAAVNLAHALRRSGLKVGLLDADIQGPSLPRMMGLTAAPETRDGVIIPPPAHGIACMSMGLLVGEDSALVWRGPQLAKALAQLLRGVAWGSAQAPLDMLLIDMPPGTGDVHLSLAQQAPLGGAVLITTPQEVAVADARKCADMFRKVNVPILGVIENMSGFADGSGKVYAIFGAGGGERLAKFCNAPLLGSVPIDIALREASDAGREYEDKSGYYRSIAAALRARLTA